MIWSQCAHLPFPPSILSTPPSTHSHLHSQVHGGIHPRGQTNACENITFPQLRLCVVIILLITDCILSMGKGYVFTGVCHSVHRGVCFRIHPTDPPSQIGNTVNVQSVLILLECILFLIFCHWFQCIQLNI